MKAVSEFGEQEGILEPGSGHVAMGASKRGWLTWMVGAADSDLVHGIIPIIPIVPALIKDMHRQWRSYGGFSFVFDDFLDVGLIDRIDDPATIVGL